MMSCLCWGASAKEQLARCQAELADCRQELSQSREEWQREREQRQCGDEQARQPQPTDDEIRGGEPSAEQEPDPALTDYLPSFDPSVAPVEASLEDLIAWTGAHDMVMSIYCFSELPPGRSLQQHVQELVQGGACPGPFMQDTLMHVSQSVLKLLNFRDLEQARQLLAAWWSGAASVLSNDAAKQGYSMTPLVQTNEWTSCVRNLLAGHYGEVVVQSCMFGIPGVRKSCTFIVSYLPIVVTMGGKRYWGMTRQAWPTPPQLQENLALRNQAFNQIWPTCFSMVSRSTHEIVFQNRMSTAMFGSHGLLNSDTGIAPRPRRAPGQVQGVPDEASGKISDDKRFDFLEILFNGCKEKLEDLKATVLTGVFCSRVEILHPTLRSLMGLKEGTAVFHDIQIIATHDPVTLEGCYTIIQIDVTQEVLAQQALQSAHVQLKKEKKQGDLLLKRQYKLIECLGKISKVGDSEASSSAAAQLVEGVLQQIAQAVSEGSSGATECDDIKILKQLGEGAFGKVYKAIWRGTVVAVKLMVLPSNMVGSEKRERLAVMEAAISSSLSHPNVVQTYTYTIQPISGSDGLDVRLVQEFCDGGSLKHALLSGAFSKDGRVNYRAVLETAADVAKGLLHLHALNILHLDLKAHNVLLKSTASESRCITAKIADFGLSLKMDRMETHVSSVFSGTPSHMAPEVYLNGFQSKAADVYAFGILMWELYTARSPFAEVPSALLAHQVSMENLRPAFDQSTPAGYSELAQRCWDSSASARPSVEEILDTLSKLRKAEGGDADVVEVLVDIGSGPPLTAEDDRIGDVE